MVYFQRFFPRYSHFFAESLPVWGTGGRRFKSSRSDHLSPSKHGKITHFDSSAANRSGTSAMKPRGGFRTAFLLA